MDFIYGLGVVSALNLALTLLTGKVVTRHGPIDAKAHPRTVAIEFCSSVLFLVLALLTGFYQWIAG